MLDRIAQFIGREHSISAVYTMFDDGKPLTPDVDALPHTASFLNTLPGGSGRLRRWLLAMYPWAVDSLSGRLARNHESRPIDLLISTSSAAIKGLRPPEGVPHLCYCHAPARYVWSQNAQYRGGLRGLGLRVARGRYQNWDRQTAANVTRFLANSTHIASEIERCYGREAHVVHPPVRTDLFTPDQTLDRNDSWLIVSALEPYKRIDLAVEAAMRRDARLIVVGTGSQQQTLLAQARGAAGIEFRGRVSLQELLELYRTSRLLLYPQVEDFGITAVEAQSCGMPVVARGAGGALDSVRDGETGCLYDEDSVEALLKAIDRVPEGTDTAAACRQNALGFSEEVFDARLGAHVRELTAAGSRA